MKTIVAIDGDLLAFKSAAANEERSIEALHVPTGRVKTFKHRTEMKKAIDLEKFPLSEFEITDVQTPGDISHALHTVKMMVQGIVEKAEADTIEMYMSGNDNFRDTLPLPEKYKGNRVDTLRPIQLKEVRDFLVKKYKAIIYHGEADDMLSIRQNEAEKEGVKLIVASIDKDTYGCDGWMLNWDKMDKPFFIEGLGKLWQNDKGKVWGTGFKWKCLQWTVGDSVDNLKPTHLCGVKFGEKSAFKILDPLETYEDCIKAVAGKYKEWYPEPVKYVDQCDRELEASWIDLMQVYFLGIHMKRWETDTPSVRDMLVKIGVLSE
jgi:hypothetical protein